MRKPLRPDVTMETVISLYQTGLGTREVAKILNCSRPTIQERLNSAGIPHHPPGGTRGRTAWNKGVKLGPTGRHTETEFKPSHTPWWVERGLPCPGFQKGHTIPPWNKGLTADIDTRVKRRPRTEEEKEKIKVANQSFWDNHPEQVAQCIRRAQQKPNAWEQRLDAFLQAWFPNEWLYNGATAEVVIGRKVPDFININGLKSVVELWGEFYHKGEDPQALVSHYGRYGYTASVIWARELYKPEKLKQRLLEEIYKERRICADT